MATVTCTKSDNKTTYTCTGGTANGCAKAIGKLKALDAGKSNSPSNLPIADFKLLDVAPGKGDSVIVGLRKFEVEDYDIIVVELEDDVADVIVFKGEILFFRNRRPMRQVSFAKDNCISVALMEAFDQEEEFVRLDVRDLEDRFFKKFISPE